MHSYPTISTRHAFSFFTYSLLSILLLVIGFLNNTSIETFGFLSHPPPSARLLLPPLCLHRSLYVLPLFFNTASIYWVLSTCQAPFWALHRYTQLYEAGLFVILETSMSKRFLLSLQYRWRNRGPEKLHNSSTVMQWVNGSQDFNPDSSVYILTTKPFLPFKIDNRS